jgi:ABC-type polar amino acid transport system ATPase subunit
MLPIIRITNLDKFFGRLQVLKEISLEIYPQEVVCIIGRSGAGKSTLLRCINYLEEPSFGDIEVDGCCISAGKKGKNQRELIHEIRLRTGMVFQEFNLFPHMTALENVMEGPVTVKKMDKASAVKVAEMNLERVGLLFKKNEYPNRLSGGQKQRVAIARALAMEPKVMLFDEPTSALDPELIGEVLNVMKSLAREGTTMLVVTHEMEFACDVANRVIVLHDGELVEQGTPANLLKCPQNVHTQALLERYRAGKSPQGEA